MAARRERGWRDRAAADLLDKVLRTERVEGPALLVDYGPDEVPEELEGIPLQRWDRADTGGRTGASWPPEGPFASAFLRLPRSRESLEFALHATASVLASDAPLFVFGAKDEGIGSTAPRMETVLADVASLATGGRCRVLRGFVKPGANRLRAPLSEWREVGEVDLGDGPRAWVRYPGTFARRGVDPGTALLLAHLPSGVPASGGAGRVLDFGAGSGLLAAGFRLRYPEASLVLVEPDALARAAAAENVPGARFAGAASWPDEGPFDAVVSNPPYHQGKTETLQVVRRLVEGARNALAPGGELRLVVQRRHPVDVLLGAAFGVVEAVADEGPYRVWAASEADPG